MQITGAIENLGTAAFYKCKGFTGDLVLNNVKEIPEGAFYLTSFSSITITSPYLTTIGSYAFGDYESGKTHNLITVDLSGCTNLKSIEASAFASNENLEKVILPEGLVSIESGAFSSCYSLTDINIPQSLVHIGKRGALPYNNSKNVDGFQVWGKILYGYVGSQDVTSLTIPDGVEIIADDALGGIYNPKGLTSITFPDGLRSIGGRTLYRNTQLTSVSIPSTVEYIGFGAFSDCSGLTSSVTLPSSLKYIGREAFKGCTGLGAITIPASVEEINGTAFQNCTGLLRVTYNAINATNPYNTNIFAGCSGIKLFLFGTGIKSIPGSLCIGMTFEITIPETVETVEEYAFRNCTGITSVPSSLKTVGDYAFYGCTGLNNLAFDHIETIGKYGFYGCSNVKTVTFGDALTSLGESALQGTAIKVFDIPGTIKEIGKSGDTRKCPWLRPNQTIKKPLPYEV